MLTYPIQDAKQDPIISTMLEAYIAIAQKCMQKTLQSFGRDPNSHPYPHIAHRVDEALREAEQTGELEPLQTLLLGEYPLLFGEERTLFAPYNQRLQAFKKQLSEQLEFRTLYQDETAEKTMQGYLLVRTKKAFRPFKFYRYNTPVYVTFYQYDDVEAPFAEDVIDTLRGKHDDSIFLVTPRKTLERQYSLTKTILPFFAQHVLSNAFVQPVRPTCAASSPVPQQ